MYFNVAPKILNIPMLGDLWKNLTKLGSLTFCYLQLRSNLYIFVLKKFP